MSLLAALFSAKFVQLIKKAFVMGEHTKGEQNSRKDKDGCRDEPKARLSVRRSQILRSGFP